MSRELMVISSLLAGIREFGWLPGSRLPDELSQAGELGVSRTTIRRAMARLEAHGVIERRRGSGTYLRLIPTEPMERKILASLERPCRKRVSKARIGHRIVTQRTYRLAFLHNWATSHYVYKSVLAAVSSYAQSHGHELLIGPSRPSSEDVVHRQFSAQAYNPRADGVVLWVSRLRHHDIGNLRKIPVPYVLIEFHCPYNNTIGLDLPAACRQAVTELVRSGHSQIAVLEKSYHRNSTPSVSHVCDSLRRELDLPELLYSFGSDPMADMPTGPDAPTGIYVTDDVYCGDLCRHLRRAGLSIGKGEDMEVISLANRGDESALEPEVGRMEFDVEELGRMAMQKLEFLLNEKETVFAPIRIGARYIAGRERLDAEPATGPAHAAGSRK